MCTTILVGMVFSVSEIKIAFKFWLNFTFEPWIKSMVVKIIESNRTAQNHATIEDDMTCMHNNFGGRGLSSFGNKTS